MKKNSICDNLKRKNIKVIDQNQSLKELRSTKIIKVSKTLPMRLQQYVRV